MLFYEENGIPKVNVVGQSGSGKSETIVGLSSEYFEKLLQEKVGKAKSTIRPVRYYLNSLQDKKVMYITAELVKVSEIYEVVQKPLIEGSYIFIEKAYINKEIIANAENLSECIRDAFLSADNTHAHLALVKGEAAFLEAIESLVNLLLSNQYLQRLYQIYLNVISDLDKFDSESEVVNKYTEYIKFGMDELLAFESFHTEYREFIAQLYLTFKGYVAKLFKTYEYGKDVFNYTLRLQDDGSVKDEDKAFVRAMFNNNNDTDSLSIELLFQKIVIKVAMSDNLIQILNAHPDAGILKRYGAYRIVVVDNQGMLHASTNKYDNKELLMKQMTHHDLTLYYQNASDNLNQKDMKEAYQEFLKNQKVSRRGLFIFTHFDICIFNGMNLLKGNSYNQMVLDLKKESQELLESTIDIKQLKKGKIGGIKPVYLSNKQQTLAMLENMLKLSLDEFSFCNFLNVLVDELVQAYSFNKKTNRVAIANETASISFQVPDESLAESSSHREGIKKQRDKLEKELLMCVETGIDVNSELVDKVIKQSLEKLKEQYIKNIHGQSYLHLKYYLQNCIEWHSDIYEPRYEKTNLKNVDTYYAVVMSKLNLKTTLDLTYSVLQKYIIIEGLDVESEESLKQAILKNLVFYMENRNHKHKIIGDLLVERYEQSRIYYSYVSKYRNFILSLINLMNNFKSEDVMREYTEALIRRVTQGFHYAINVESGS